MKDKWKKILEEEKTIIKEDTESTKKRVLGKRYEIDNLLPQIVEKVNELRETLSEYSVKITEPSISETDNIVWIVKWIDKKIMFTVEVTTNYNDRIYYKGHSVKGSPEWETKKESFEELIDEFLYRYKREIVGWAQESWKSIWDGTISNFKSLFKKNK